jgi:hypothetical protein
MGSKSCRKCGTKLKDDGPDGGASRVSFTSSKLMKYAQFFDPDAHKADAVRAM